MRSQLQLLHRLPQYNPDRTHYVRILWHLLTRLPHPPEDRPLQTPKANLHPQPKLHPLHRRRTLRLPWL